MAITRKSSNRVRIAELKEKAIRDEQNALAHATEDGINIGPERGRKERRKE